MTEMCLWPPSQTIEEGHCLEYALRKKFSGDLNIINGFVSNLFLAAYASVNYACFDASFAKSPG